MFLGRGKECVPFKLYQRDEVEQVFYGGVGNAIREESERPGSYLCSRVRSVQFHWQGHVQRFSCKLNNVSIPLSAGVSLMEGGFEGESLKASLGAADIRSRDGRDVTGCVGASDARATRGSRWASD